MESSVAAPINQQTDDEDNDENAVIWEGLMPLHVEKIVDPLAPTFEFKLISTQDNKSNNDDNYYRSFTIDQDLEGRRKPAIPGGSFISRSSADTENNSNNDDYNTALAEEGLTENQSRTGAVIWDGAVVAAGILDKAATFEGAAATERGKEKRYCFNPIGKKVIELGCGCAALPGMVAIALGAEHVVLTDLEIIVESDALSANLERNLCDMEERRKVSKMVYRWGKDNGPLPQQQQHYCGDDSGNDNNYDGFDLILACDTVYDMALVKPLLESIEILMRNKNDSDRKCMALVCYDESIGRKRAYRFFREEAKRRFEIVENLTEAEKRQDLTSDSVTALRIMHPKENNAE